MRRPRREARFDSFANDEPCAALDPLTGLCDLYSSRPVTCRVFGPPVRSEQGLGICELCYHGATPEEIAACEMPVDPDGLEAALIEEYRAVLRRQRPHPGRLCASLISGLRRETALVRFRPI